VILLDQIIDVFGRPDPALIAVGMSAQNFPGCAMRGLITIERDLIRQSPLALDGLPEECFGGRDISLGAEQEINRFSLSTAR
jgi:hypothetical protein